MKRRSLPESVLRDLADRAGDYGLSRRAVLSLFGAAGGAAALSGCGGGGSAQGSTRTPGAARGDGTRDFIVWANWPYYIDTDGAGNRPTLNRFVEESGVDVVYREVIVDNDSLFAQVRGSLENGQDIGYDLVTLSDQMAGHWRDQAFIHPLDRAAMPNMSNLILDLVNPNLYREEEETVWTLPWQSFLVGVAWNKEKVPGGLHNFSDLWAPELAQRVEIFNEFSWVAGLVLWEKGIDPAKDWGDAEFNMFLQEIKKNLDNGQIRRLVGNEYLDNLVNGVSWAATAYSGDIFQINQEALEGGAEEPPFEFAIPDAGGLILSDNFLSPFTSDLVTSSQQLINFYYDPVVAAAVTAYVAFASPVAGVQTEIEKIAPEMVDDPTVFPTPEALEKLAFLRWLTNAEYERYTKLYRDIQPE